MGNDGGKSFLGRRLVLFLDHSVGKKPEGF